MGWIYTALPAIHLHKAERLLVFLRAQVFFIEHICFVALPYFYYFSQLHFIELKLSYVADLHAKKCLASKNIFFS